MQDVVAKSIDKNNFTLIIYSDEAIYNNLNYNTKFRKNVQIEFEPVEEILLREKDGRHAACIIEPKKVNQEA